MDKFMIFLLNQSLYASYLILLLLVLHPIVKKLPRKFSYLLWIFVFIRLALPFSLEIPVSIHRLNPEPIPQDIIFQEFPSISSGVESVDRFVNSSMPVQNETSSINPLQVLLFIFQWVWGFGIALLLAYTLYCKRLLRKKLNSSTLLSDNIYLCKQCSTAFISGIAAKIYIPDFLSEEQRFCVIMHEKVHIARLDHLTKSVTWFLVCLHWFNPLVWISFFLLSEDMEVSCDQKVIELIGEPYKKLYSSTLLELSVQHPVSISSPVSFGETSIKKRISSVLSHKSPKKNVAVLGFMLILCIALFSFTKEPPQMTAYTSNLENLYRYKTAYVGDNSKVGNILNILFFPDNYKSGGFEILSSKEPYGLNIFFECKSSSVFEDTKNYVFSSNFPYLQSAMVLFSLIDNVENINYIFTYSGKSTSFHYKRKEIDPLISNYIEDFHSCKTAGESKKNFSLLCKELRLPDQSEDWTSYSKYHQESADRILDKYLPDTIGEDFAFLDYRMTAQFERGNSEEFFIKTIPSIDYNQSLAYAAFHFDRGRLISYYLKPYGYDFEKGNYFRTRTKNHLHSIDNTSFNVGSEESPSYVNVTLNHPLIYFGTKSSSDGQNTFLQESKPLTLRESEELANEFIHEFIDKGITLSYAGENDKGYGQNFEDALHRYRVIVASDLGYVFRFHDMR